MPFLVDLAEELIHYGKKKDGGRCRLSVGRPSKRPKLMDDVGLPCQSKQKSVKDAEDVPQTKKKNEPT